VLHALESWLTSCPFNLAHELKRTENVLKGTEMRETEMEVAVLCRRYKIQKRVVMREIEA